MRLEEKGTDCRSLDNSFLFVTWVQIWNACTELCTFSKHAHRNLPVTSFIFNLSTTGFKKCPRKAERPTADRKSEFMKLRLLGGQNYQHLDKGFFFFFDGIQQQNLARWCGRRVIRKPSCSTDAQLPRWCIRHLRGRVGADRHVIRSRCTFLNRHHQESGQKADLSLFPASFQFTNMFFLS